MRAGAPQVTVAVVTWQGAHLVGPCLASLAAQSLAHDVVLVDNASTDGTAKLVRRDFPRTRLVALPRNAGFAGGVHAALAQVHTPYLALLNNDAVADPRWLQVACAYLDEHPGVAAVSSRMLLAERPDVVNNAGVVLLSSGYGADRGLGDPDGGAYHAPVRVFGASGGACVLRTLAVKAVGGVDPRWFLYYEDTDLSWRLRLGGWEIHYCPQAVVYHRHAASSDVRSASFAFHNERNRLLTLARNAPLPTVAGALAAYLGTTISLAVKRTLGVTVPDHPTADPALRLRALASGVRLLPAVAGARTSSSRRARRRVLRQWRGVQALPIEPG